MYQIHCYTPTRTTERIIVTTAEQAEKTKSRLAEKLLRQDRSKEPEPVFAVIVHTMRVSGQRSRSERPGCRAKTAALLAPASVAAATTEEQIDDPFADSASASGASGNLAGSVFLPVPEGMKYCRKCDQILPIDAFHRDRTKKDGRCTRCCPCSVSADRARYAQSRVAMSEADIANTCVVIPGASKRCCGCGQDLPLDAYHKKHGRRDGHESTCRTCAAERYRIRTAERKAERAQTAAASR